VGSELRRSRSRLEARLTKEIVDFENRYEIPSAELEAALERGDIQETAEVATWVIAYRTLRALADERQARSQ
jgi:hypothetical protein